VVLFVLVNIGFVWLVGVKGYVCMYVMYMYI